MVENTKESLSTEITSRDGTQAMEFEDNKQQPDESKYQRRQTLDVRASQLPKDRPTSLCDFTKNHFEFLSKLGTGSYGKVYLVKNKAIQDAKEQALKVLNKEHIVKYDKVTAVFRERDILLATAQHPNIVRIEATFQDDESLYFLLEYCSRGSFGNLFQIYDKLPFELAQFYTAEIVSALEYLQEKQIVHRDLKPENILLDANFNSKLTDFGDSKQLDNDDEQQFAEQENEEEIDDRNSLFDDPEDRAAGARGTFVGTPLYVSPEMLDKNLSSFGMDMWALGCIVYQMFTNKVPFFDNLDYQVFQKISEGKYEVPEDMDPRAKDLISQLLKVDHNERIGSGQPDTFNSIEVLKKHKFFEGIDFANLKSMKPPIAEDKLKELIKITEPSERLSEFDDFKRVNQEQIQAKDQSPTEELKDQESTTIDSSTSGSYKTIMKRIVVYKKQSLMKKSPFWNMILTDQPRLYFTSTKMSDGIADAYKKDLNLVVGLDVQMSKQKDCFEICNRKPHVRQKGDKVIVIQSKDAEEWVTNINKVLDKREQNI